MNSLPTPAVAVHHIGRHIHSVSDLERQPAVHDATCTNMPCNLQDCLHCAANATANSSNVSCKDNAKLHVHAHGHCQQ